MKQKFLKLLSLFVVVGFLMQGLNSSVLAQGTPQEVDATITHFEIQNASKKSVNELNKNDFFYLAMDWQVSNSGSVLHSGDYFDITLPNNLTFPPGYSEPQFDLTDSEGNVIARAVVTTGPEAIGGKIRVTFNDKINNKYNVKGKLYLGALFNKRVTKDNVVNQFDISVKGKVTSTNLKVTKVGVPADQIISKWGQQVTQNGQRIDQVEWYANINYAKADLKNAVITDELPNGETYIPGSFVLEEVEYTDEGAILRRLNKISLDGKLQLSNNNQSFTINMGDTGAKQYRLTYRTTYTIGSSLRNKIKVTHAGGSKEHGFTYKSSEAGGTADGQLASKIKLTKVDEEDKNIVLANAVFEVTGPDNQKFELRTGKDGTIISGVLKQGTYTVREIQAPTGYQLNGDTFTLEVTPKGGALKTITNKRIKINISGEKTWDDTNDQDGKRPSKIRVNLLDENQKVVQSKDVTPDASGKWVYTFENVDEYNVKTGKKMNYTITEEAVEGYTTEVTGYDIKNSYTPKKTSIQVTKSWNDAEDQDGKRPTSVTITLYADGQKTDQTLVLNKENNWTGSFSNLDVYKAGKKIEYTIKETTVENGYASSTAGSVEQGFTVTNSRTPEKTSVKGTKTWDDANDQDGKRPKEITIKLLKNGQEFKTQKVTAADGWKWSFDNLDKYENKQEITYTVVEEQVEGYTTKVNGYDITNSYTPGKTSVQVTKAWDDANNQDGKRPATVTVTLYADGQKTDKTLQLTKENNWTGSFTDLDEFKSGKKIEYSIKEESVENGYVSQVTGEAKKGYVVTNSRTPEKTSVKGSKTWDDANNQDGKRPKEITINLLKNGQQVATKKVTEADEWKWSFDNLDKYENGQEITYTIVEEKVEGYTATVKDFNVTNSYTPGKTSIQVTKAWDDANDQDGVRPTSVTIKLLADGKETDKKLVLSKENNWTGNFTDLNEYKDGKKIEYTISEEKVGKGYTTLITGSVQEGFVVTNKRTPNTPPEKPKDELPKTGTGASLALLGVAALIGGVAVLKFQIKDN